MILARSGVQWLGSSIFDTRSLFQKRGKCGEPAVWQILARNFWIMLPPGHICSIKGCVNSGRDWNQILLFVALKSRVISGTVFLRKSGSAVRVRHKFGILWGFVRAWNCYYTMVKKSVLEPSLGPESAGAGTHGAGTSSGSSGVL